MLGEVSDFQGGSQPPKSQFINSLKDGYVRLLQIRDFKSDVRAVYIPVAQKNKICSADDIMIARYGASVGQIHRGKGGAYNVALIRTIPDDSVIDQDFFYYYLTSDLFQKPLLKVAGSRSAQAGFSKPDIANFPFLLPSLSEQKRIVVILDKAFAGISQVVANAEKNLVNVRELFERYLQGALFDKKWKKIALGEVCDRVEYGSSSKSIPEGKLPVLRMGNIKNGRFILDKLVYSDNEKDNKQYLLKYNDVLFNRTNSPELVGKTAIYKGETAAIFAGYLIRIHRKEDLLDADYLNYYLNSGMAMDYGKTVFISSVNQANINGKKLKSYPIPIPSLREQQTIVKKLDALSAETKKLEIIYQQKLTALTELKQSILQKAFAGELH